MIKVFAPDTLELERGPGRVRRHPTAHSPIRADRERPTHTSHTHNANALADLW